MPGVVPAGRYFGVLGLADQRDPAHAQHIHLPFHAVQTHDRLIAVDLAAIFVFDLIGLDHLAEFLRDINISGAQIILDKGHALLPLGRVKRQVQRHEFREAAGHALHQRQHLALDQGHLGDGFIEARDQVFLTRDLGG